jgi:hypothetical protein
MFSTNSWDASVLKYQGGGAVTVAPLPLTPLSPDFGRSEGAAGSGARRVVHCLYGTFAHSYYLYTQVQG